MRAVFLSILVVLGAGCGDRAPAAISDLGGTTDGPRPLRDSRPLRPLDYSFLDSSWPADTGTVVFKDKGGVAADSGGMCAPCKPGEVYLMSSCVSSDKLFTCAAPCTAGDPASCPAGEKCDLWGATPCCVCSAAVPACVPLATTGKVSGPLRIYPTTGIAGQKVTLKIEGAPFYIGALFYMARMGKETKMQESPGTDCSFSATFTPPNPGAYAVEVSQYGGGAPWVLAGFFTASGGVSPMPTVQPGFWCSTNPAPGDPACASAPPYSCSCIAGRCVCK